jgi:hypothetical protein
MICQHQSTWLQILPVLYKATASKQAAASAVVTAKPAPVVASISVTKTDPAPKPSSKESKDMIEQMAAELNKLRLQNKTLSAERDTYLRQYQACREDERDQHYRYELQCEKAKFEVLQNFHK